MTHVYSYVHTNTDTLDDLESKQIYMYISYIYIIIHTYKLELSQYVHLVPTGLVCEIPRLHSHCQRLVGVWEEWGRRPRRPRMLLSWMISRNSLDDQHPTFFRLGMPWVCFLVAQKKNHTDFIRFWCPNQQWSYLRCMFYSCCRIDLCPLNLSTFPGNVFFRGLLPQVNAGFFYSSAEQREKLVEYRTHEFAMLLLCCSKCQKTEMAVPE